MVERQDIDALLISALYGELTPSQESQLTAHLASHPADKAALDGLTVTRDAVRASRILAVQVDPPQQISALLIQEAARRAPKAAPSEGEGWFARFVRSFVQHPAMAAAAMLVLVVGIAAVVGRNKGNQFAGESEDRALSSKSSPTAVEARNETAPAGKFEGGAMGSSTAFDVAQQPAPAQAIGNAGSGSAVAAGYADTGAVRDNRAQNAKGDANTDGHAGDRMGMGVTLAEEQNHQGSKIATADGIVVSHRADAPKELAVDEKKTDIDSLRRREELEKSKDQLADKQRANLDDDEWKGKGEVGGTYTTTKSNVSPTGPSSAGAPANGAPGAGASAGAAPPPPPSPPVTQPSRQYASPPAATRPSPAPTTPTTNAPAVTTAKTPQSVAPVSPAPAEAPKPEPKSDPKSEAAPAKKAPKTETKSLEQATPKSDVAKNDSKPDPTTEWAKAQHAALVAKARDGQCNAAADLAVQIENRAPGYYTQNVATDRDLKACWANIASAREKDAEKRASAERAKKSGAEPKAAKKADAPAKTTTTDSVK